jgi:hypothetical protein
MCLRTPQGIRENEVGPLLDLSQVSPTWSLLDGVIELSRYAATVPADSPRKALYIEAGRGCPFACSFCATAPFWQRRYRVKPVEVIVAEIRDLHERFHYDTFMLVHDLLTVDKRFVDELCEAMFAAALPVEWTANHRADIPLGPLAAKMRSAGCLSVFMGIESASERLQAEFRKGLTRSDAIGTVTRLRQVGISSTCSFIVGFPSETAAELSNTLSLAAELKMLGAEPVQIHRLRRWPPAPLAARELPAAFDLEALRLEYPAQTILDEDVDTIAADPSFFMGYFTPATLSGSQYQLAQLELFFAHMLEVLPVTMATLAASYGDQLVLSWYAALEAAGPLTRDDLDSTLLVRDVLTTFVEAWIEGDWMLEQWQRDLVLGALAYERVRIGYMAGADADMPQSGLGGEDWSAFAVSLDVEQLVRRLALGDRLDPGLCVDGHVLLTRRASGAVRGFAVDGAYLVLLQAGDKQALAAMHRA